MKLYIRRVVFPNTRRFVKSNFFNIKEGNNMTQNNCRATKFEKGFKSGFTSGFEKGFKVRKKECPENCSSNKSGIIIRLTVAYVEFGGNSGNNYKYFHAFDNNEVIIEGWKEDTDIEVNLVQHQKDENGDNIFNICGYAVSDDNLLQIKGEHYSIEKKHLVPTEKLIITCKKNHIHRLSNFVIMVQDKVNNNVFCCDPQVINSPPPPN